MERPVLGLFVPGERPHLILPELERGKAEASELDAKLFAYGEDQDSRARAFQQAAADLGLNGRRVAVEPTSMRVLELRLLEAAAPQAEFIDAEEVVSSLRVLKDEAEVSALRRSVAMAETALEASLTHIRLGMTEKELASELTLQLLRAGSEPELPFSPIVASGPNSALPHAAPSDRRFQAKDLLILDWGARAEGYVSDLTRTFALAEVDPDLARVHETVRRANAAGLAAVQPGATCEAVDRAARAVIAQDGYGDYFIHRTGHGVGLEAHEPPFIREGNPRALSPGMTLTVEPGIYLPGRGGVRVEDNVLVTPQGSERLSTYPRGLKVVG
jgi:Xaa-Pro dipeptidase